jgi:hypothetical protein
MKTMSESREFKRSAIDSAIKREYASLYKIAKETEKVKTEDPSHYVVFAVPDLIPPHLAMRFYHTIPRFETWEPKFRILDYEIVSESGTR